MNQPRTPYYLIDEAVLIDDLDQFTSALHAHWGNHVLPAYSVKTNALPWLLHRLCAHPAGFAAEVVSVEEIELAEQLGFSCKRMIYNGPIKDRAAFFRILQGGGIVNLDSSQEIAWLREADFPCSVGIRVNLDSTTVMSCIPASSSNQTEPVVLADEEGSRFGYSYEDGHLALALEELRSCPQVRIAGLHLHQSTKSRSVAWYAGLAAAAVRIAEQYDLELDYVDMGGGYYGGVPGKPSLRDYIPAICSALREGFDPAGTKLIMEPGISLISSSMKLVTSVLDVKEIRGHRYIVTDGSRLYLNPQVTRRVYPHHLSFFEEKDSSARPHHPHQMICGSTCMEYDRLFDEADAPALEIGDQVIYDLAGGYTMCLAPLFIHYFPPV